MVQAQVTDTVTFIGHISDNPLFFEMSWQILPELTLKAGKLLVPFGSNEYHHLIGGRVDELSDFLPETWADFGVGLNYLAYDGEDWSLDVDLAVLNGFQGREAPAFATAGGLSDNNANKGIALRLSARFLKHYRLIGSAYYDVWDLDDIYNMVFYSLAAELSPGFVDLPVLDRIGLRGEWARGEVRLPGNNPQRGILGHAFARSGFYAEIMARVWEEYHLRFRCGRINPDNTVTDEGDLWVFEPALVIGTGRLSYVIAYQLTMQEGQAYQPDSPSDVLYAKFFLRY